MFVPQLVLAFIAGLIEAAPVSAPLPSSAGTSTRGGVVVDRIAAVIENTIVTQRELETKARVALATLEDYSDPKERERRRQQILHQTLDEIIAERLTDTELNKLRERMGAVADAEVEHAFEETAKMNSMTKDQLTAALYNQGQTVSEFKNALRRQMERTRYLQMRTQNKTGFSEKDIAQRCAELRQSMMTDVQIRARHVLVKVTAEAPVAEVEKAKAKIDAIYEKLKAGADFEKTATSDSEDQGSPGGDLGYFRRGEMMPAIEQVAFSQKIGDLSKPVRTRVGFHVVRVEDKRVSKGDGCDDEATKQKIQGELYNREVEHQMKLWVDELRKKAYVDVKI